MPKIDACAGCVKRPDLTMEGDMGFSMVRKGSCSVFGEAGMTRAQRMVNVPSEDHRFPCTFNPTVLPKKMTEKKVRAGQQKQKKAK